ncbi:MAG: NAD-dependent epimerase/dehydratase family protein [Salinivirgaceae bacterium]
MNKISILGSDSFIATQFLASLKNKEEARFFSRQASGKPNEMVKDLFEISHLDFQDSQLAINFAAIVHQPKLKDEALYKRINTDLPIHLAEEAKKAGVRHFIQMSTIAVYGDVELIDGSTPENPLNVYGKTKWEADKALLALQDESFKVSIIRPPMVYGGGKAPGNLQSLIKAALKGIPLPFKGVENKRDFIHVGNLIQALHAVIENKLYGVIIPTDKKSVSTWELITYIDKYSDNKIRNIKIPGFIHTLIKMLKPKIYSKVFGDLQVVCTLPNEIYQPTFSMKDGIKEMVESLNSL